MFVYDQNLIKVENKVLGHPVYYSRKNGKKNQNFKIQFTRIRLRNK